MALLAHISRHLLELLAFALAAWAWGRILLRLPDRDRLEGATLAAAAGIGILGSLLHVLGLLGWLTRPAVLAILASPLLALQWLRGGIAALRPPGRAAWLLSILGLLPALWLSLYPPTAFDATLYHLPTARAFAEQHGVSFLPTLRFPVFPQLIELLFAAAITLSDDIAAQLVHFFCLAVTAALLAVWGRRLATPRAGLWAAAAFLGNPLVLSVGASANVDIGIALFGGAAVFSWWVWREEGDRHWLVWCAVFAGFGASAKYTGLFLVAALPAATLLVRRDKAGLRDALRLAAVAVLVALPFYARIVAETGNPLFPYFERWFGPSAWTQPYDPLGSEGPLSATLVSTRVTHLDEPLRLVRIPLRLVTPGGGFGKETIYSPWSLLLAPLLFWPGLADRRMRPLVLLGASYALFWYVAIPDRRYLFLVVPALTVVAAAGLDRVLRSGRQDAGSAVSIAVMIVLLSPGILWSGRALWKRGSLPVTSEGRHAYLARALPVYPALRSLNETLGARYTVYGLYCENAAYYCRGRFLGDHFGPYRFGLVTPSLSDSRALHSVLASLGATHLLVGGQAPNLRLEGRDFPALFRELPAPAGVRLFELSAGAEGNELSLDPPVSSGPESDPDKP